MPKRRHIFKKCIYFQGSDTSKKIILKGREFRCGSDEKMMGMWFGLEIDVVGLPPLAKDLSLRFLFAKLLRRKRKFLLSLRYIFARKIAMCAIIRKLHFMQNCAISRYFVLRSLRNKFSKKG